MSKRTYVVGFVVSFGPIDNATEAPYGRAMMTCDARFDGIPYSNPIPVAETPIAHIWRVTLPDQQFAALKIYKGGNFQDEAPGFDFLTAQDGQGTARLLARTSSAVLLEWLEGESLADMVRNGEETKTCHILIDTANRIHAAPFYALKTLDPLDRRFKALFDAGFAPDCAPATRQTIERARCLARDLLARQTNMRPMHGDLHHDNIKHSARGYLAFDAKGVVGERTYELANAFRNPIDMQDHYSNPEIIKQRAAIWAPGFGVKQSHLLAWVAAYSALSLAWAFDGQFGPENADQVALIETYFALMEQADRPNP